MGVWGRWWVHDDFQEWQRWPAGLVCGRWRGGWRCAGWPTWEWFRWRTARDENRQEKWSRGHPNGRWRGRRFRRSRIVRLSLTTGFEVAGRRGGPVRRWRRRRRLWRWRWRDLTWNSRRRRRWKFVCGHDGLPGRRHPPGRRQLPGRHEARAAEGLRRRGLGLRADSASVSYVFRTSTLGSWRRRDATSPRRRRRGRGSFVTASFHTGGRRRGPGRRGRHRRVPGGQERRREDHEARVLLRGRVFTTSAGAGVNCD